MEIWHVSADIFEWEKFTWSTGQPPPRSMAMQGGEGAGIFWPPIISPVTITVPFMGTLAAEATANISIPCDTPNFARASCCWSS